MSPDEPSSTCHVQPPSHFPVVGSALKLHGQPQSQLHATRTVPARFHVIRSSPNENVYEYTLSNILKCSSFAMNAPPSGGNCGRNRPAEQLPRRHATLLGVIKEDVKVTGSIARHSEHATCPR